MPLTGETDPGPPDVARRTARDTIQIRKQILKYEIPPVANPPAGIYSLREKLTRMCTDSFE